MLHFYKARNVRMWSYVCMECNGKWNVTCNAMYVRIHYWHSIQHCWDWSVKSTQSQKISLWWMKPSPGVHAMSVTWLLWPTTHLIFQKGQPCPGHFARHMPNHMVQTMNKARRRSRLKSASSNVRFGASTEKLTAKSSTRYRHGLSHWMANIFRFRGIRTWKFT